MLIPHAKCVARKTNCENSLKYIYNLGYIFVHQEGEG